MTDIERKLAQAEREIQRLKSQVDALRRGPRKHPLPWDIAEHWLTDPTSTFYSRYFYTLSSGSVDSFLIPHCFRCDDYMPEGRHGWALTACGAVFGAARGEMDPETVWNLSGRWLIRAHLVDRARGGLDVVANMVMLCRRCHHQMPSFGPEDIQEAVTYVRGTLGYDEYGEEIWVLGGERPGSVRP